MFLLLEILDPVLKSLITFVEFFLSVQDTLLYLDIQFSQQPFVEETVSSQLCDLGIHVKYNWTMNLSIYF